MYMNKPVKVAIVGGGISGLSLAYFLERKAAALDRQLAINLFESSSRLGGKIRTVKTNDLTLELGAESFLSRKSAAIELCRAVGIDGEGGLRGTRPENRKSFVWHSGRLHQLPAGLSGFVPVQLSSLFSSSLLGFGGKLRVLGDYFVPPRRSTDDESIGNFITRRLGKAAYQRLVEPLLCGIYAGDGWQLSLSATYPELRQLERAHGSLIRGLRWRQRNQDPIEGESWTPFVTLAKGVSQLIEAVNCQLTQTSIHLNCAVVDLRQDNKHWQIVTADPISVSNSNLATDQYDAVILACPAFRASTIVKSISPDLSAILDRIPHVSTITVNLWLRSATDQLPLDGYGFVIPSEEQQGITAITWTSSKHFDRAPDQTTLLRVYLGRAGAEADCDMSDDEVMAIVYQELKRTMGIKRVPDGFLIQRWPQGSPQYTLGHVDRLDQINAQLSGLPGLYLGGASYRGVGIPDCIGNSQTIAHAFFANYSAC